MKMFTHFNTQRSYSAEKELILQLSFPLHSHNFAGLIPDKAPLISMSS